MLRAKLQLGMQIFLNNVGGMLSKRYFNPKYVKATNLKYFTLEIWNFMVQV
jgi:hypothetical protein